MKRLTNAEFSRSVLETGGYATPPGRWPRRPAAFCFLGSFRYAWTIIGIIARCTARFLFGKLTYRDWQRNAFRSIAFAERAGAEVAIDGFEKIRDNGGPVVYVMNHMSTLETMVAPAILILFGEIAIVLKTALDKIPFMGRAARSVGSIPVTRTNPREDLRTVFTKGCESLAAGKSVLLFPQGTRQAVFGRKRFNSLGAKLAERAGVPLAPVAVRTDLLQTGRVFRDFGRVDPSRPLKVSCGPLLPPSLGARAMHERSVDFIAGKLQEWGLEVE